VFGLIGFRLSSLDRIPCSPGRRVVHEEDVPVFAKEEGGRVHDAGTPPRSRLRTAAVFTTEEERSTRSANTRIGARRSTSFLR
jgi:hypothetical protein